MCSICSSLRPFDASCGYAGLTAVRAEIPEDVTAPEGTTTTNVMSVGDTFLGALDTPDDDDWVAITLTAGESYEIGMSAAGAGVGTLEDPVLRLYDASGAAVSYDDDGGTGSDARIVYTATADGTYYIAGGSFLNRSAGTYEISVALYQSNLQDASLATLAAYLTDGYWEFNGETRHAFDTSTSNIITVNLGALPAEAQFLARAALDTWETVANIQFQEVTGRADILFKDTDTGAYSNYFGSGGVTSLATVNVSANWIATYGTGFDSYSYTTYVHEIGHALGLGHQGPYNGSAEYPSQALYSNDSYQLSVMSYFSQTDNTDVAASYAEPITPMAADIIAIQDLYGAPSNGSRTAGDTIYGVGQTLGGYFGQFLEIYVTGNDPDNLYDGGPVAVTLYDVSGVDTVDFTTDTADQFVDLNGLGIWNVFGLTGSVVVAPGTVLENYVAGSGNDTVIGNGAANRVEGRAGNDDLRGAGGDDTLLGGGGDDRLNGGAGVDTFVFSTGNDVIEDFNGDLIQIAPSAWSGTVDALLAGASVVNGNLVLDFGAGKSLTLEGVTSTAGLAGQIEISTPTLAQDPDNDFNGDGFSDVLVRSSSTGAVVTLDISNGTASAALVSARVPAAWGIAGTGDFNGDQTDDILWRNDATGTMMAFEMSNGTPSMRVIGALPLALEVAGTGDLNGDGVDDILLRQPRSGAVISLDVSGAKPSGQLITASTSAQAAIMGLGDFNGDGTDDILWRDLSALGNIDMFAMNAGLATQQTIGPAEPNAALVAIGDFTGDSVDDILWRTAAGDLDVWMMSGTTPTVETVGALPLDWDIAGTGDFNGDGVDDVLARHGTTGEIAVYDVAATGAGLDTVTTLPLNWVIEPDVADEFVFVL